MVLDNSGNLHCDGDVTAFSTTTSSDEKLKENIEIVADPIEKVKALKGVDFTWKKDGTKSAGVIAQDVEAIMPHLVKDVDDLNGEGSHKAVNYDGLHAIMIEAIKTLSAKVEELEAKLNG